MTNKSTTVFVVDDDAGVRKGLSRMLRSAGHIVETFESATAYLNHQPSQGPSCVVLDVHMPEFTGLELQAELTKQGRDEQIIFITAHAKVPMTVQAMKGGAIDFLTKPFDEADLFAAVKTALERAAERSHQRAVRNEVRAKLNALTIREFEVLQCVTEGLLNKQIADQLGVALGTVKVHRGRVMEKLGVVSVAELVRLVELAGVSRVAATKGS